MDPTAEIWNLPVEGRNLTGATFDEQFAPAELTLLVFLRHFG